MRWMGMNEQRACLRIEILLFLSIFVLFFVSRRSSDGSGVCCDKRSAREAHASWCVYNYAVIKLIYDEKTRDRVADNFYHLNGYSSSELDDESFETIQIASDAHINQPLRHSTWRADFKAAPLIEWDSRPEREKRKSNGKKNCFTHAVIVSGQAVRSTHVARMRTFLSYGISMQILCVRCDGVSSRGDHGPKLNQRNIDEKTTRNENIHETFYFDRDHHKLSTFSCFFRLLFGTCVGPLFGPLCDHRTYRSQGTKNGAFWNGRREEKSWFHKS